jgi:hypothetical protein
MLLGHTRGGSVLLASCCEELLAISAACIHYGGPLTEVLLIDERS